MAEELGLPFQRDCIDILMRINSELANVKELAYGRQKWDVGGMEDLIELLSILRGTNPEASLKYGYVHETPLGKSSTLKEPKRFVYYADVITDLADQGEGPLDEMQTILEMELYSEGFGWPALEEKRAQRVGKVAADATLGEIQGYWDQAIAGIIDGYGVNPVLGYRRPYRQEVR